ncbi:YafY family transcriptional regulator [Bacillus cereus]|uniref:YafY family transcriptional regulator n=4 Tax=Bacillus cereus group TaxID=86661 RepID=A0A9X7BGH5_BACCE|nr:MULTISPECIES: YafY family protein [Bacillus]AKR33635.1 Transcriptional regulator [Bacillus thuringiensis serovar indiana]EOQ02834.1 DeoR family transcriptional regulator [Bacillus cereus VD140]MBG9642057.1 DeoR family transcriptional regulator [Bacillus thuringiensis]MDJ0283637.1 YafY family protein [Bacillus bombysepticus]OHO72258.1 DNA-binding transcriptional regulator [Bacillus sp. HMSC036E02]OTX93425.1 DNA-binding transcriptional regulator [Bacillus thuringiensis serovar londrina]OTY6
MSKAKRLLDILIFASAKKAFTAQEIADEFNISVRTVHRYILDLSDMGLPIYAEQGRNGGYKVLTNRVIPPILFTEEEAVSIFFAFQSLSYYRDLPFNTEINSVTHKLYSSLQHDAKAKVDKIRSYIAFWNPKRTIETPLLNEVLTAAIENKNLHFQYESKSRIKTKHVHPIGVYAHDGLWYLPAYDFNVEKTLLYRVDRILSILSTEENEDTFMNLEEWFASNSHVVHNPTQLHVLLSTEGVRQCKSVPYLEEFVVTNENGTGYIHSTIDKGEINFITPLFYRLGKDAKVLEPIELIDGLRMRAKEVLHMYEDEKSC